MPNINYAFIQMTPDDQLNDSEEQPSTATMPEEQQFIHPSKSIQNIDQVWLHFNGLVSAIIDTDDYIFKNTKTWNFLEPDDILLLKRILELFSEFERSQINLETPGTSGDLPEYIDPLDCKIFLRVPDIINTEQGMWIPYEYFAFGFQVYFECFESYEEGIGYDDQDSADLESLKQPDTTMALLPVCLLLAGSKLWMFDGVTFHYLSPGQTSYGCEPDRSSSAVFDFTRYQGIENYFENDINDAGMMDHIEADNLEDDLDDRLSLTESGYNSDRSMSHE